MHRPMEELKNLIWSGCGGCLWGVNWNSTHWCFGDSMRTKVQLSVLQSMIGVPAIKKQKLYWQPVPIKKGTTAKSTKKSNKYHFWQHCKILVEFCFVKITYKFSHLSLLRHTNSLQFDDKSGTEQTNKT